MKTDKRSVDEIHPDPSNARKHSPRNIDAIAASLHRFGQQKPIVVDSSGVVRAGNGTLEAAKKLGWTEVTVVESDLEGAEMTAFAIADNRTAELAHWGEQELYATLQAMRDVNCLDSTGFAQSELDALDRAFASGEDASDFDSDYDPSGEGQLDQLGTNPTEPIVCPHCGGAI